MHVIYHRRLHLQ